jgi:hypothetical protein
MLRGCLARGQLYVAFRKYIVRECLRAGRESHPRDDMLGTTPYHHKTIDSLSGREEEFVEHISTVSTRRE